MLPAVRAMWLGPSPRAGLVLLGFWVWIFRGPCCSEPLIAECLAAFFCCIPAELDSIKGRWEWQDENGKRHERSNKKAIEDIRNRNIWGFVENKKTIHYFVRKKATLRQVVDFFAHEIGHMQRPFHRSLKEEMKAAKYSKLFGKSLKNLFLK